MTHKCNICDREFKRIYELERHKIRINKCKPKPIDDPIVVKLIPPNPPEIFNNSKIITDKITVNPPIPPNNNLFPPNKLQQDTVAFASFPNINNDIICYACNKIFARSDNLKKHINGRCKEIKKLNNNKELQHPKNIEELSEHSHLRLECPQGQMMEILKKIQENQKQIDEKHMQEINELKNTILELKEHKLVPYTNINSNNTTNNTTNNTINNIIVKFGTENPAEKLTTKEIQYIINAHQNSMLQRSIEITHFNNKHPDFQNVYIPDKKMQTANIYNGKKYDMKSIDSVVGDLILNHINNLDDYKKRDDVIISDNKHEEIDHIVDNFQNYDETGSDKEKIIYNNTVKEIKEMLYNNKDKVMETHKRSKKRL